MAADGSVLVLVNMATIGLLPRLFFRKDGRFNLAWWLTAAPFFVCAVAHVGLLVGWLEPIGPDGLRNVTSAVAIPLAALSIGLIGYTVGSHRVPLALWHQGDAVDAPAEIVTWGPYRWVRHPFYTAFLIALTGGLLAGPHVITAATLAYGIGGMTLTARREEARLRASDLGDNYVAYARRTGRFVPRVRAAAA